MRTMNELRNLLGQELDKFGETCEESSLSDPPTDREELRLFLLACEERMLRSDRNDTVILMIVDRLQTWDAIAAYKRFLNASKEIEKRLTKNGIMRRFFERHRELFRGNEKAQEQHQAELNSRYEALFGESEAAVYKRSLQAV